MRCNKCEKEIDLISSFGCKHCGNTFCAEHRLPEGHDCEILKIQRGRSFEPLTEAIASGEMYPKDVEQKDARPKEIKPETRKPKRKIVSPILVFCIILIIVGVITAYTGYNYGYNSGYNVGHGEYYGYEAGYNAGYSEGYDKGCLDGNLSGYNTGYNVGYGEAYAEGYLEGHNIGYSAGNLSGYETGYDAGYIQGVTDGAGRGYNIRDPTYQEALQFMASDQTDKNEYTENYTCFNFAADFKTNAFNAGYRCGLVYIEFQEALTAHGITCFNTTDYGIIFVEPQTDEIVNLTIGQPYFDMGTVTYVAIVW